jgi:hypothetical protein
MIKVSETRNPEVKGQTLSTTDDSSFIFQKFAEIDASVEERRNPAAASLAGHGRPPFSTRELDRCCRASGFQPRASGLYVGTSHAAFAVAATSPPETRLGDA